MKKIKFAIREDIAKLDDLGIGYIYEVVEHPSVDDLVVIHFEENGKPTTRNYTKRIMESKFKKGVWITQ